MAYNTKGTATPWYRQPAFLGGLGHAGAGLLAAAQRGPVGQRPSIMTRTMAGLPGVMQAAGATEMQRRLYEQQVAAGEREAALAPLQTQALEQGIATRDRAAKEAERVRRQREGLRELYGGYGGPTTTDLGTRGPAATLARIGELAPEAVMQAQLTQLTRAPTTPKPQAVMDWTDPKNPTPRFVSTQEAISNPNFQPIPSGLKMQSDGKGGFTLATGTTTLGELTKPIQSTVAKTILEQGDVLGLVTQTQNAFRPEFQQISTRMKAKWTALQEKFEGSPLESILGTANPEDRKLLTEYMQFRQLAFKNFTAIMKAMSGVAINPEEINRAKQWIPAPGTGLFDGDSPTEMQAKLKGMAEFTRNIIAKYHYVRNNQQLGLSFENFDSGNMPRIIQERGEALFQKFRSQGMKGNELDGLVRKTLGLEFGLYSGG